MHVVHWGKLFLTGFLIIGILITVSGCVTQHASVQSDDQKQIAQKRDDILVTSKEYSAQTNVFHIEADVYSDDEPKQADFLLQSLQTYRFDADKVADHWKIEWFGFYNDTDSLNNLKITDFEGNIRAESDDKAENTITSRIFKDKINGKTITVILTRYSAEIKAEDRYRENGAFYDVIAVMRDNSEYYVAKIPLSDDRKASEKKQSDIKENSDGLEYLGDGLQAGENGSNRYCFVFNKSLSHSTLDSVSQIKVKKILQ
ncbi:MAG: hypothetical protein ACI4CS_02990 [Candidatus Weimeria sp.]